MKKDFHFYDPQSFPQSSADIGVLIFEIKKEICVEPFKEGALLLNLNSKVLTEINQVEHWVWNKMDGKRSIKQIAETHSRNINISLQDALQEVGKICARFWKELNLINLKKNRQGEIMDNNKYIQNPDVNLREEDEDGALLFNPDTDQVKLLSKTGHYIWEKCVEGITVKDIVAAFKDDFENVPVNQVKADVEEFLNQMVESGFIGVLDNPKEQE